MFFNSIDFGLFLPIVFLIYWFVTKRSIQAQNVLILIASYVFYGWWDWEFLLLIFFSTVVDFSVALGIESSDTPKNRKLYLSLSLFTNLGLLFYFKYVNFFIDNFNNTFSFLGLKPTVESLNIILPVGISFYTFQTLSYTIDVYKKQLTPTKDFIAFAAFVSFFPQLVAGPIERASHLLPQFYQKRTFEYNKAVDGLKQILWGLFKKVVIADNCAEYANIIFNNSDDYHGFTLILGAIFFTFQIYGDFSGYSDIAIGTARLFGFDLMQNFAFPYFSRNMSEFWRRWHISLSTWFRDYLYIPLGGSRGGTGMKTRNTFIIFIVSGFWHGANWTFIFWGALNALFMVPSLVSSNNKKLKSVPLLRDLPSILLTFSLTVLTWVFFRAENLNHAFSYISGIFSIAKTNNPIETKKLISILTLLIFCFVIEWNGRKGKHALESLFKQKSPWLRYSFYFVIFSMILTMSGGNQEFIYFQF